MSFLAIHNALLFGKHAPPPRIIMTRNYWPTSPNKFLFHININLILTSGFRWILVTPIITVNCSSISTVNQGDYFACECNGTYGNPPAVVTWYKGNTQIVTGKEEAILRLTNVTRHDGGTYRCEARSEEKAKNITEIELIVIGEYD